MSNLLERAIIDAKALKEAALKNAEQLVIEKYSLEVKEAMSNLLEQEEADAMADLFGDAEAAEDPALDTAGEEEGEAEMQGAITADDLEAEIPDAFMTDEDEIIQIKLDALDDEIEDDEEGPFAGDDKLDDDEIGIDIEDEEDALADVAEPDVGLGGDVGIDITSEPPISAGALEEIIADALQDVLSEEEEEIEIDDEEELVTRGLDSKENDETGRNEAIATFKQIQGTIVDDFGTLANDEDRELYHDYLKTNILL